MPRGPGSTAAISHEEEEEDVAPVTDVVARAREPALKCCRARSRVVRPVWQLGQWALSLYTTSPVRL